MVEKHRMRILSCVMRNCSLHTRFKSVRLLTTPLSPIVYLPSWMYKFQSPFFFVCGTDLITTTAQLSHLFFFLCLMFLSFSAPSLPPRRWTGCQMQQPQTAMILTTGQHHRFVDVYFLTPIVCSHCKYSGH